MAIALHLAAAAALALAAFLLWFIDAFRLKLRSASDACPDGLDAFRHVTGWFCVDPADRLQLFAAVAVFVVCATLGVIVRRRARKS